MDWMKLVHPTRKSISLEPFGPGDDVRVWYKILEQGKERLGQFEGVVIRYRGAGASKTFTVRRVTYGVGVERVFPVDAPVIERVEVLRHGKTKRARLYFLRHVVGSARLKTAEGLARASAAAVPPAPATPVEKAEDAVAAVPEKPAKS